MPEQSKPTVGLRIGGTNTHHCIGRILVGEQLKEVLKKEVGKCTRRKQKLWMKIQYSLLVFLGLTSTLLAQTTKLPDTLPLIGGNVSKGAGGAQAPPTPQVDPQTGKKIWTRSQILDYVSKNKPNKGEIAALLGKPNHTYRGAEEYYPYIWYYTVSEYKYITKDPESGKIDEFLTMKFGETTRKEASNVQFKQQF